MLGVLALRRRAGIAEFRDEVVQSPEVRAMMQRVKPYLDEGIEAQGFERIRSRVEVELSDGAVLTREASASRGTPEWPMSREDLRRSSRTARRACCRRRRFPQRSLRRGA